VNAPAKRNGPVRDGPIPKLFGLAQSNSGVAISQHVCRHNTTRVEQMPPGSAHLAREVCATCGCWLRWLPKPQTIERRTLNAFRLARLGMCEGLSKWERSFVHHVSQQRKLSPRQQVLVARLCTQYLEGAP
jgi:hypothetical protein